MWVEEDLGVPHVLLVGPAKVRPGQIRKVLGRLQDPHPFVVAGEEGRQVVEGVGGAGGHVGVRERHPVALSECELQFRLQGALDVDVQLHLWYAANELGQLRAGHRPIFAPPDLRAPGESPGRRWPGAGYRRALARGEEIAVVTWDQFAKVRPDLAAIGRLLLPPCGIAYLGTTRGDGGPRVHPVCPAFGRHRQSSMTCIATLDAYCTLCLEPTTPSS